MITRHQVEVPESARVGLDPGSAKGAKVYRDDDGRPIPELRDLLGTVLEAMWLDDGRVELRVWWTTHTGEIVGRAHVATGGAVRLRLELHPAFDGEGGPDRWRVLRVRASVGQDFEQVDGPAPPELDAPELDEQVVTDALVAIGEVYKQHGVDDPVESLPGEAVGPLVDDLRAALKRELARAAELDAPGPILCGVCGGYHAEGRCPDVWRRSCFSRNVDSEGGRGAVGLSVFASRC